MSTREPPSTAAAEASPRGPELDAVRLDSVASPAGIVTYSVIDSPPAKGGEQRASSRRRTRLRSGKIVDLRNNFVCDCVLHDRSRGGLRVRLVQVVELPDRIRIFDDELGALVSADIVWRRGKDLGIRIHVVEPATAAAMDAPKAAALGRKFYAVGNGAPRSGLRRR